MERTTAQRILEFVQSVFAVRLRDRAALECSSPLFSSGLIDSMGAVELLAFIEQEFCVSINLTNEELNGLDTAEGLAGHVASLQSAQHGT